MRKGKQLEGNLFLESGDIFIYKEVNNTYYVESHNENLNYFFTIDYLESVAALMKVKEMFNVDQFWNIKITKEMRENINFSKSLYWITGGSREWERRTTYNTKWGKCVDLFLDEYKDKLEKINKKCETLGEVREEFLKHLNLPIIYEFSLNNGLIN